MTFHPFTRALAAPAFVLFSLCEPAFAGESTPTDGDAPPPPAAPIETGTEPLPTAGAPAARTRASSLVPSIDYRVRGVAVSAFPLDADGNTLGQETYGEHRLRLQGKAAGGPISLTAEADITNGLVAGDRSSAFPYVQYRRDRFRGLADPDGFTLRQIWMEARTKVGLVRAGQMTSKWGLGLVAHDGAGDPMWGDRYFGDLVERAVFATRPLSRTAPALAPFLVALGGDVVLRDQSADLVAGDRAYQGILSLVWNRDGSPNRAGFYGVRRSQVDRDGFDLAVWVVDAHAKWQRTVGPVDLGFEGELARIWGETDAVRDIYVGSRDIDQMGGAVELSLGAGSGVRRFDLLLQGGYASGDDLGQDGRITAFKFDPEYNVGFILFDEVLAWQTAATARAVSDPDTFGRPAAGARFLPTEGSVTNARYVMPTVQIHPFKRVSARVGVLIAQADRALDDAFQTNALHGGVRHTTLGSTTDSRDLGIEVDYGVRYAWDGARAPRTTVDLQFGRFYPGDAFVDADGNKFDPVDRLVAGLTLSW